MTSQIYLLAGLRYGMEIATPKGRAHIVDIQKTVEFDFGRPRTQTWVYAKQKYGGRHTYRFALEEISPIAAA